MPGELILVPKRPDEPEPPGPSGNEITEAAPEQLSRRRLEAVEADHAKPANSFLGGSPEVAEEATYWT